MVVKWQNLVLVLAELHGGGGGVVVRETQGRYTERLRTLEG
jgi:hypothetical protein